MKPNDYVDELLKTIEAQGEELPEDVEGAINDLLVNLDENDASVPWYKAPFCKHGKFSKTATFVTLANVLVITSFILGWFQGTVLGPWTVPAFDVGAGGGLLLIVNGTYVANRLASARENGGG
jgi:hypothetical protein